MVQASPVAVIGLTPSWWAKIRRDASGAIPMAIEFALRAIKKTDFVIHSLRATPEGLYLEFQELPKPEDLPSGYDSLEGWAMSVVATIESEITIEPVDYVEGPAPPTVTRAELEAKLAEVGFRNPEIQGRYEDDPDVIGVDRGVWNFSSVGSAACYVRLTLIRDNVAPRQRGQLMSDCPASAMPDDNDAVWGDAQGELSLNYAAVMAKLAEFASGGMVDAGAPRARGVFEELGSVNPFSQVGKNA